MSATVIEGLRRFLPAFLRDHPVIDSATRRAIWAISNCRTPTMGGRLYACQQCGKPHYACHSCNHRCCPLCGKHDTAEWVRLLMQKRGHAPYFMVTFTLPQQMRALFAGPHAKAAYDAFFAAASTALAHVIAHPRWIGAQSAGFTMILHTWNQRMHFHPHIHAIVPGIGIDTHCRVVTVKRQNFLVPQPVLRKRFREQFRRQLASKATSLSAPLIPDSVWQRDWGVHLQPFGQGNNIIKYLGAYVCRAVIGDSRIIGVNDYSVRFMWKDRAKGGHSRIETLHSTEFVRRFLRHVLPNSMRAIRHYGFCHPAAKRKRQIILAHTATNTQTEQALPDNNPAPNSFSCPTCKGTLIYIPITLLPRWKTGLSHPMDRTSWVS